MRECVCVGLALVPMAHRRCWRQSRPSSSLPQTARIKAACLTRCGHEGSTGWGAMEVYFWGPWLGWGLRAAGVEEGRREDGGGALARDAYNDDGCCSGDVWGWGSRVEGRRSSRGWRQG